MRRTFGTLVLVLLGIFLGWILCVMGCSRTHWSWSPKEANVVADSLYAYHLPPNLKTIHLSLSAHEVLAWTFDADSTVDSVTAVFGGPSPFASHHFEFSDSAAFSGAPIVSPGVAVYDYTITVYPHSRKPVIVDPGIIIDM